MMGCGKTTIGKSLAKNFEIEFIDCDDYLEKRFNTTISDCFDISEKYFRKLETECLKELCLTKGKIISTGGGVVLNKRNMEFLKDEFIIFINRPIENILSDVDYKKRPLIKNDKEKLRSIFNERIDLYKEYCHIEIKNDSSLQNTLIEIIESCKEIN